MAVQFRDFEINYSLLYEGFGKNHNNSSPEFYFERLKRNLENDKIPFTMIVLHENKVVGTASTYLKWGDEDVGPWFGLLCVMPQYRQRGIAKMLFEAIRCRCVDLGYSIIFLHTPNQEKLYAKWGWKTLKTIDQVEKVETLMEFQLS